MERVASGIYGLDDLCQGGFPKNRNILVSGATGTGKTILGMQYLYNGAMEYDEPGIYVAFDEPPEKIREDMVGFGWNIAEAERKELFHFIDASVTRIGHASEEKHVIEPGEIDFDTIIREVIKIAQENEAKRLVIDSIPALAFHVKDISELRMSIFKLSVMMRKAKLTSVMTTEVPEQSLSVGQPMQFSKFGVEEYVADGVLLLNYLGIGGESARTLYIRKMRGTKHSEDIHPIEIASKKGVVVKKAEEIYKA